MHMRACRTMTTYCANQSITALNLAIEPHLLHQIWIHISCIRSGSSPATPCPDPHLLHQIWIHISCIRSGSSPATPCPDPHLLHQIDSCVPRLLRLAVCLIAHGGRPNHSPAAAAASADTGATSGATLGYRRSLPAQSRTT